MSVSSLGILAAFGSQIVVKRLFVELGFRIAVVCVCAQLCPTLCNSMDYSPSRLLCPWDFLGKNTGVGCHFLLQAILLAQKSNLCLLFLLHWRVDSLPLSHLGNPNLESGELISEF